LTRLALALCLAARAGDIFGDQDRARKTGAGGALHAANKGQNANEGQKLMVGWRRGRIERAGFALYNRAVAAGRETFFYETLGVPDTLDGRFDLVGLHVALLIRRLRHDVAPGPALAQAVFDAMFSDMDVNLRELGVGDLSVGKRVRAMWEAFHGRARAYETALDAADPAALSAALVRNVWRGRETIVIAEAARHLAALTRAEDTHLARQGLAALAAGEVNFRGPAALAESP
jgi:cytochrome b pre-mRNA-processing protein 3